MYQHMLAAGEYDSVAEYDILLALARDEYESEQAREEYEAETARKDQERLLYRKIEEVLQGTFISLQAATIIMIDSLMGGCRKG